MEAPQEKINRISTKLSNMKTIKATEHNIKLDESSQRLLLMEESMNDYIEKQNREFNNLREEVLKCERIFLENRSSREARLTN